MTGSTCSVNVLMHPSTTAPDGKAVAQNNALDSASSSCWTGDVSLMSSPVREIEGVGAVSVAHAGGSPVMVHGGC